MTWHDRLPIDLSQNQTEVVAVELTDPPTCGLKNRILNRDLSSDQPSIASRQLQSRLARQQSPADLDCCDLPMGRRHQFLQHLQHLI